MVEGATSRDSSFRPLALGAGIALSLGAAIAAASAHGSSIRAGAVERTDLWPLLFLALLVTAVALYLGALWVLRGQQSKLVAVFIVAVAIQLTPLAGPLLLSRDAFSYWAYGRIAAVHHRNPSSTPPASFPTDPATHSVARGWRKQTSVYGPAFTVGSAAVSDVAQRSSGRASLLFRLIATAAGIGATGLAATIARRKSYAAAFVGWNPVVAISFAGGGHNDAWMIVLLLGALALVSRNRDAAGGALWAFAGMVKAAALPLLALQLLRSRRALLIGAVVATGGIVFAATTTLGTASVTSVWQLHQREARYSLPARLEQLALPEVVAHVVAYVALAAGALWLARQARRYRPRLALGASLLVLTSPWVLPWYSTWPVALAATDDDGFGQVVALTLVLYLLPDRIPL